MADGKRIDARVPANQPYERLAGAVTQRALDALPDAPNPPPERILELRREFQHELFRILMKPVVLRAFERLLRTADKRIRNDAWKVALLHMVPIPEEGAGDGGPPNVVIVNNIPRPPGAPAIQVEATEERVEDAETV